MVQVPQNPAVGNLTMPGKTGAKWEIYRKLPEGEYLHSSVKHEWALGREERKY